MQAWLRRISLAISRRQTLWMWLLLIARMYPPSTNALGSSERLQSLKGNRTYDGELYSGRCCKWGSRLRFRRLKLFEYRHIDEQGSPRGSVFICPSGGRLSLPMAGIWVVERSRCNITQRCFMTLFHGAFEYIMYADGM